MKKPVICGIVLNEPSNIIDALIEHNGGDCTAAYGVHVFDDYAPAVAGFSETNDIVYDFDKMVQLHMERDGMTQEEAEKFVNFNVISTFAGMERPPVILYPVDGYEKEEA